MTTIDEIYAAINPLPAQLSAKGKTKPNVEFRVEANAVISMMLSWQQFGSDRDWEREYEYFPGTDFTEALTKVTDFIAAMPTAEQARLNHFMGELGNLIDAGRSEGIDVDFLNPLIDTMKRLSENVLTYKPKRRRHPLPSHHQNTEAG